ncbi:AAA family ATPase, partial [Rhizobium ruizarguesonis]
ADTDVMLAAETNVEDILATLAEGKRPDLVIIDSIQTLWSELAESAPGTVTQVRTGVQAMIRFAKQTGAAMVLVGHVTKDWQIAGPRVVEHMVDAVLYFEGDR